MRTRFRRSAQRRLQQQYPLTLQTGLIVTLLLLIVAFQTDWLRYEVAELYQPPVSLIQTTEVMQTAQHKDVPPPPRPAIPLVVPNETLLEQTELTLDPALVDLQAPATPPALPSLAEDPSEMEPFRHVEEMPELIGGMAALQRNIRYPELARRAQIEGRVIVEFVVDVQGRVTQAKVLKGIGGGCDEAALEAVLAATFKPGKQRGRTVPVRMTLPVSFRLR